MTRIIRFVSWPALVILALLGAGVAGAPTYLPAPAVSVSSAFKAELSAQPSLSPFTLESVLSLRLDISDDPSVRSNLVIRSEPTTVLPLVRRESPEQSVHAPGLYLAVQRGQKFHFLIRLGDPRQGLAEYAEGEELKGVAVERAGGTLKVLFPYFDFAQVAVYEVRPGATVVLKFKIDLGPSPFGDDRLVYQLEF